MVCVLRSAVLPGLSSFFFRLLAAVAISSYLAAASSSVISACLKAINICVPHAKMTHRFFWVGGGRKRKKGENGYKRESHGRDGPKGCVHPEGQLSSNICRRAHTGVGWN